MKLRFILKVWPCGDAAWNAPLTSSPTKSWDNGWPERRAGCWHSMARYRTGCSAPHPRRSSTVTGDLMRIRHAFGLHLGNP